MADFRWLRTLRPPRIYLEDKGVTIQRLTCRLERERPEDGDLNEAAEALKAALLTNWPGGNPPRIVVYGTVPAVDTHGLHVLSLSTIAASTSHAFGAEDHFDQGDIEIEYRTQSTSDAVAAGRTVLNEARRAIAALAHGD